MKSPLILFLLGPEMACVNFMGAWDLLVLSAGENLHNSSFFGGEGIWGFGGGGSANFMFMGAAIFLILGAPRMAFDKGQADEGSRKSGRIFQYKNKMDFDFWGLFCSHMSGPKR